MRIALLAFVSLLFALSSQAQNATEPSQCIASVSPTSVTIPAGGGYSSDVATVLAISTDIRGGYLFDAERCGVYGKTFTQFDWKYFHLGPWTREFEVILGDLVASGMLGETVSANPEYETKFYGSSEHSDFSKLFQKYKGQEKPR